MRHLLAAMDALVATVEQETELVRAGKLKEAAALEAKKAELAQLYAADTAQVKANIPALKQQVPELLAALRKQHETFNALLQINLTVLATAHAVVGRADPRRPRRGRAQERAADLWRRAAPGPAARHGDAGFGQPHAVDAAPALYLPCVDAAGEIISRTATIHLPKIIAGFPRGVLRRH